jgi:hypothetical protein
MQPAKAVQQMRDPSEWQFVSYPTQTLEIMPITTIPPTDSSPAALTAQALLPVRAEA